MKTSRYKLISFFAIIFSLIFFAFLGYSSSSKISNFESACQKLGFQKEEEQDALITIFNDSGYFMPEKLWSDINNIGFKDPEKAFNQINKVVAVSNLIPKKNDSVGEKKYLRKNLFNNISEENAIELIVWWAQNGFNRKVGIERSELQYESLENKKEAFFASISKLGLSNEMPILHNTYDSVWIMGARRESLYRRIDYYKKNSTVIKNDPKIFVLVADDRELFAELDGLTMQFRALMDDNELKLYNNLGYDINREDSQVLDGIKYIIYLANKEGMPLVKGKETIKYNSIEECLMGRLQNRTYPNYDNPTEGIKITEKEMAQDLICYLLPSKKITLITASKSYYTSLNLTRASTGDTVVQAAKVFMQQMLDSRANNARLLIISNNPYLARQSLIVEREINKEIKERMSDIKIKIDSAGWGINDDSINFSVILSELGGLIMEKYKNYLISLNLEEINIENMVSKLSFVSREEKHSKSYNFTPLSIFGKIKLYLSVNPFNLLFSYI